MTEEPQEGETRTLWLLICDIGYADEIHIIYATSEEDAEHKAQIWIEQQGERIKKRISLTPRPHGFRILKRELPGTI